jgi:hypothetical protein
MVRRLSLGGTSFGSHHGAPAPGLERPWEHQGHGPARIVDFPGNPRLRPRAVAKLVWASDEIQQRCKMLIHHALLITEESSLGVASKEEVANIITHHFELLRYEFHVFRSAPEPFIVLFSDRAARDVVFVRGRVLDGPVELHFHSWDVDHFCDRVVIPFHVKLSIEGLPQHAWFQEIAKKVLCDEAIIHHVDQATRHKEDHRLFVCWAFCQNLNCIPQMVYLTLSERHGDPQVGCSTAFLEASQC